MNRVFITVIALFLGSSAWANQGDDYLYFTYNAWRTPSFDIKIRNDKAQIRYFIGGATNGEYVRCEGEYPNDKLYILLSVFKRAKAHKWKPLYENELEGIQILHGTSWKLEFSHNSSVFKSRGRDGELPKNYEYIKKLIFTVEDYLDCDVKEP